MPNDSNQSSNLAGGLPVGSRALIFPSRPMPDFDAAGGPAFGAQFQTGDATGMMGVLCNTGLPPRLDFINAVRNLDHPGIIRYIDSGVALWSNNARYYTF